MTNLLEFKERVNKLYAKYGRFIKPIAKFILAFVIFTLINSYIGYDQRLHNTWILIGLSVISALLPSAVFVLIVAMFSVLHVYYVSPIFSLIVIFLFLILYLLFIRFMPNSGYVIVAMPILYILKVPFVMPILLGLISGPVAIIPLSCGVIVYYLFFIIKEVASLNGGTSVEDILDNYKYVIDSLMGNKEMLLTIVAFGMVLLVTYFVRNLSIDYAFYVAILAGMIVNILAYLVGDLVLNVTTKLSFLLVGSIVSGIIVFIVQFFRLTLDYSTVEYTHFEDDDYYYYVKAVPKVKIAVPEKNVKRISGETNTDTKTKPTDEEESL